MSDAGYPPIADLLPHAGDMVLLDAVVEAGEEHMVCSRTVRADGLFEPAHGLSAWTGVELMAQAVAAWAGWQARCEHRPVRLGFLLGTRHYRCDVDVFPPGTELRVEAVRSFHDEGGMGVFACRIDSAAGSAEARLSVFSPPDPDAFLASLARDSSHD